MTNRNNLSVIILNGIKRKACACVPVKGREGGGQSPPACVAPSGPGCRAPAASCRQGWGWGWARGWALGMGPATATATAWCPQRCHLCPTSTCGGVGRGLRSHAAGGFSSQGTRVIKPLSVFTVGPFFHQLSSPILYFLFFWENSAVFNKKNRLFWYT